MAYEEPRFQKLAERDDYEVRRYAPYLVAETTVPGNFDASGNQAFRRLAGYIFGKNDSETKMQMTIPVTREATNAESYTYAFVMESKYDRDALPIPKDNRVTIREMPERTMAVLEYNGRTNFRNYQAALEKLTIALERDGITILSTPQSAVYNGPFTLPWMRRNEVLIEVDW